MKYLTSELLQRCRSLDDDIADEAAAEWERAVDAYRERLRAIRLRLPSAARRLVAQASLHDAKVLTISAGRKRPALSMQMQLEGTTSRPAAVLRLDYLLVAGPHGGVSFTNKGATGLGTILYDEFDLDEDRAFFTHSLLLSGDREVSIRFHHLSARRLLNEVFLPPFDLPEGEKTWPLVEA